jgi:O-antigen/teichoic acid export membrane protein
MIKTFFSNNNTSNKKKFYFLFTTLFFKTIINFLLLFYIAKVVNVSDFGSFTLSFVVMTIGVLLIDYGYNLHSLVLDYNNKEEISNKISSIISGKFYISTLLILLAFPILYFISLDEISKKVIFILSLSSIPNSFGNFYFSLFKAKNNYKVETNGFLIQGLLLISLITLNHFLGSKDIVTISIIVLITKITYFIYSFFQFKNEFSIQFRLSIRNALQSYVKSYNYGVHLIFGTLILYVETIFLSYFSDMETVGYYQAGLRLIMAASLFGAIITDGFVPEISKRQNDKKFVTDKMLNLFTFLGVFYFLLSLTLATYFNTIINILFSSEFQLIENYTIYIILIIICRAIGIVPGVILTSLGLQKIRARVAMLLLLLSIILNLFLVPFYGLEGAFMSFLVTNVLLTAVYFYYSFKEINFIKLISLKLFFLLSCYVLALFFISKDNLFHLSISILLCLLILLFTQKNLNKRNVKN